MGLDQINVIGPPNFVPAHSILLYRSDNRLTRGRRRRSPLLKFPTSVSVNVPSDEQISCPHHKPLLAQRMQDPFEASKTPTPWTESETAKLLSTRPDPFCLPVPDMIPSTGGTAKQPQLRTEFPPQPKAIPPEGRKAVASPRHRFEQALHCSNIEPECIGLLLPLGRPAPSGEGLGLRHIGRWFPPGNLASLRIALSLTRDDRMVLVGTAMLHRERIAPLLANTVAWLA